MATPLMNPAVPLTAPITGGVYPGRMVRIQGNVHPTAQRFAINLQCGPNVNPRDDMALHIGVLLFERAVVCNSLISGQWGAEDRKMHCPFSAGQAFEILILSEHSSFKIAVNGQHFAEFHHRMPLERATYLTVDGDVQLTMVAFEGPTQGGHAHPGAHPVPGMHPPAPGHSPYGAPAGHTPYGAPHGAPPGGHVPYPVQHGAGMPYPPAHGGMPYAPVPGMHPGAQPYGGGHMPGAYPTHPGGHYSPHSAKKAAKQQRKAQKKALKYGLPVAGLGVGAYALHKGMKHGHHGSSSSSSSSSSEEE